MDYANRGRPPKKKKPAAKGKAKSGKRGARSTKQSPAVPWSVVALAIVLVVGFAWFLTSIYGQAEQEGHSVSAPPKLDIKTQPPTDADKVDTDIDPRWDYIEELENSEVQVDVPERELGPPKLMQCGSFRSQSDAEGLRARIAMVGLESQVRASEGTTEANRGTWHRVILGPYETKRDAERDRHKLQRAQIFGCQIWNWNLDQL